MVSRNGGKGGEGRHGAEKGQDEDARSEASSLILVEALSLPVVKCCNCLARRPAGGT